jgi:hypothetical protein
MFRRTSWIATLTLLLVTTACASSGEASTRGSEVVSIDLGDAGRSITLQVGDRLSLDLGSTPERHWVMGEFPRDVLSAPQEHSKGEFSFSALAPGQGRIGVINTFACPPSTVHGCSVPEGGNVSTGSVATSPLPSIFTLTVRVVKRDEGGRAADPPSFYGQGLEMVFAKLWYRRSNP